MRKCFCCGQTYSIFDNEMASVDGFLAIKLMSNKIAPYGWLPDSPDQRDHLYAAPGERPGALTLRVALRRMVPRYVTDDDRTSDFWTIRIVQ